MYSLENVIDMMRFVLKICSLSIYHNALKLYTMIRTCCKHKGRKIATMIDNTEKLKELEYKMDVVENTLNEIKSYIRERKAQYETIDHDEKYFLLPPKLRNKIDDIMENFDFERVHKVMDMLEWRWGSAKNGVPSVEELKKEAKRLLVSACVEKNHISTGGFKAVFEKSTGWGLDNDDDPYVGLEFILEEWEGGLDD